MTGDKILGHAPNVDGNQEPSGDLDFDGLHAALTGVNVETLGPVTLGPVPAELEGVNTEELAAAVAEHGLA